jgi:hypothetical protein
MSETEVKTGLMTGEQLEVILNRVEKAHDKDLSAWREKMFAEHEDNFIMVDGYVAVLDISTARIDSWDGCNGYHELTPEQYVEVMSQFGEEVILDESTMMTKQGLGKRYRFPVIINEVVGEDTFQYRIVKKDSIKKNIPTGSMISENQSIEMRMRRSDV